MYKQIKREAQQWETPIRLRNLKPSQKTTCLSSFLSNGISFEWQYSNQTQNKLKNKPPETSQDTSELFAESESWILRWALLYFVLSVCFIYVSFEPIWVELILSNVDIVCVDFSFISIDEVTVQL